MNLYGESISKNELMKYIGDISQIADAREGLITSGTADGVRVIDIKTGSGLTFSVLPSRSMDIGWTEYKGMSIAPISKTGIVSPHFYDNRATEFLRGFFMGLLTTCGLTFSGLTNVDGGKELGMHGRISNTPAFDVSVYKEWEGDDFVIRLRGKVAEAAVYGENIVLTREITTKLGAKSLQINDTIENIGYNEQSLMMLYHCNFGYPLVREGTNFIVPDGTKTRPKDEVGEMSKFKEFQSPTHDYAQQTFYHDLPKVKGNLTYACLFNKDYGLGAYVIYNKDQLPLLLEWKMMGEGDYVVGMEPTMNTPEGRAKAREEGTLQYIKPGEVRKFDLEIGVVETEEEADNIL